MTIEDMRKKLANYLQIADDTKLKALYIILEDNIDACEVNSGKDFMNELEERSKSFRDGSAKTYTWEETKQAAIERAK